MLIYVKNYGNKYVSGEGIILIKDVDINNISKRSLRRLRASPDSINIALNDISDQNFLSKYQTTDIIMDESKELFN